MQHDQSPTPAAQALISAGLAAFGAPRDPKRFEVSNDTLRALARTDAGRACGILSDEHTAILCAVLPDICAELIARRAAMAADAVKGHVIEIADAQTCRDNALDQARMILEGSVTYSDQQVAAACDTLAQWGTPVEKARAADMLCVINGEGQAPA